MLHLNVRVKPEDLVVDFITDVIASTSDTAAVISNIESIRDGVLQRASSAVMVYEWDKLDGIRHSTGNNLLYIVFLATIDDIASAHVNVVAHIRRRDPIGNILLILSSANNAIETVVGASNHGVFFASIRIDRFPSKESILSGSKIVIFSILEICAFCDNGRDLVVTINKWRASSGFRHPLNFPSSFKGSFQGATLSLSTNLFYPNYIFKEGSEWYGFDYYMVDQCSETLYFSKKWVHPDPPSWGKYYNGSWDGITGDVVYNRADIGIGSGR